MFLVAPVVELQHGSVEIEVGNNLSLSAMITNFNYPLTSITWTFNDGTITNGQDRVILDLPSSLLQPPLMSTLQRSLVIPIDSGTYTVTATNPVGSSEESFTVTVTGKVNM